MDAFFVALLALFVALLLVSERRDSMRGRWLTKPAASVLFVVAGARSPVFATPNAGLTSFERLGFAGLVLAALGDVLLIRAQRPDAVGQRFFLAGLATFLLGHVAYAGAFAVRGVSVFAVEGVALPLLLAGALILGWLWPHVPKPLRGAVVAYALVISAMVALAVGTTLAHGNAWLSCAALAFYVSDLAVARDQFVKRAFSNRLWGLPLYYAAQLAFATVAR